VRLSFTGMAASLAAPTPASNRPRSVPSPPGYTRSPSASSATPQDRPLSCRMSGTRELPYHRHDPYAGEDRLLVHIKTGNPLMHHIHRSFLHTCAAGVGTSHRRILVGSEGSDAAPLAFSGVFEPPGSNSNTGSSAPRRNRPPCRQRQIYDRHATVENRFMEGGSACCRWLI
jgi:hypothetical protein